MKELAEHFFEQCVGSYSGHMANIPYNPAVHSICRSVGINEYDPTKSRAKFVEFLRQVIKELEDDSRVKE